MGERMVLATEPVSLGLINRLLQRNEAGCSAQEADSDTSTTSRDDVASTPSASSENCGRGVFWKGYKPNPLAQEFSIDEFVAFCDSIDPDGRSRNRSSAGLCGLSGSFSPFSPFIGDTSSCCSVVYKGVATENCGQDPETQAASHSLDRRAPPRKHGTSEALHQMF